MKIVGRFVMDDEGVRVEVSTQMFAELMKHDLVAPRLDLDEDGNATVPPKGPHWYITDENLTLFPVVVKKSKKK